MYGVCEADCERSAAIKLADALDLGSSGETRKSSSLFMPTNFYRHPYSFVIANEVKQSSH